LIGDFRWNNDVRCGPVFTAIASIKGLPTTLSVGDENLSAKNIELGSSRRFHMPLNGLAQQPSHPA
jgi:hypothetical protein